MRTKSARSAPSPRTSTKQATRAAASAQPQHTMSGDWLLLQGSKKGERIIPHHPEMDSVTKLQQSVPSSQAQTATKSPAALTSPREPRAADHTLHTMSGAALCTMSGTLLRPHGSKKGARVIPDHLRMDPVTKLPLSAPASRAKTAIEDPSAPTSPQEPRAAAPVHRTWSSQLIGDFGTAGIQTSSKMPPQTKPLTDNLSRCVIPDSTDDWD